MLKTFSTTRFISDVNEDREIVVCEYKKEGYHCNFAWVGSPPLFNAIVNLDNLNDIKGSGTKKYKDIIIETLSDLKLLKKQTNQLTQYQYELRKEKVISLDNWNTVK